MILLRSEKEIGMIHFHPRHAVPFSFSFPGSNSNLPGFSSIIMPLLLKHTLIINLRSLNTSNNPVLRILPDNFIMKSKEKFQRLAESCSKSSA